MSNIATEISVDDWLILLPNVVKSRSIFQMVIITYFYAVIISYAPILGLYSQREYAYWEQGSQIHDVTSERKYYVLYQSFSVLI